MTAKRLDDHDHGFTLQQDLQAIERRRMPERLLSGATAAVIAAHGDGSGGGTNLVNGVVSDILTASSIVRSDIRSSFGQANAILTTQLALPRDICGVAV